MPAEIPVNECSNDFSNRLAFCGSQVAQLFEVCRAHRNAHLVGEFPTGWATRAALFVSHKNLLQFVFLWLYL